MNSKNNDGFYLTIGMFFVVSICILFAICGEDLIKEVCMFDKVFVFILKLIALVSLVIVVVFAFIVCISNFASSCNFKKNWILLSENSDSKNKYIIFDENVKKFPEDQKYKKLKCAVFYAKDVEIQTRAFSNCKDLTEITFYEIPTIIAKDAFLGCKKLSVIYFYGTKEEWELKKIFIPSNPRIDFVSTQKSEKKQDQNIINVNCSGTVNIKSH